MSELEQRARELREKLAREAKAAGYNINPDDEITGYLCQGLVTNIDRYGYMACPCRLAAGEKAADLDIICPCDYRQADVAEYGSCYCALYATKEWIEGSVPHDAVPERRPPEKSGWGDWPASDG